VPKLPLQGRLRRIITGSGEKLNTNFSDCKNHLLKR
jgi:hypothetical protein